MRWQQHRTHSAEPAQGQGQGQFLLCRVNNLQSKSMERGVTLLH